MNWMKYDTIIELTLYYNKDSSFIYSDFYKIIDKKLDSLNMLFSSYDTSSLIYKINHSNDTIFVIPKPLAYVIRQSLVFSQLSEGLFDITVKPLIKLWDFRKGIIPEQSEIDKIKNIVGYKNLILKNDTLILKKRGIQIDLGAISKGFIIDSITNFITEQKFTIAGIFNIGGDLKTFGHKIGKDSLWHIGLEHPRNKNKIWKELLIGNNTAVTTSGDYERFFIKNGIRYSHIINPITCTPVQSNIVSATVIAKNSTIADGLSTTILLLGNPKKISQFMKKNFPEVKYIIILEKNNQLVEFSNNE